MWAKVSFIASRAIPCVINLILCAPHEQKAFAGVISTGVPNTLWRIRSSFFFVAPPFVISYLIYDSAEKEHERLSRKQPGEFDHET